MTSFLPLEPLGIGTSEVESLPSYICRLATLHNLTVTTFLKVLRSWWEKLPDTAPLTKNPLCQRGGGVFCGVGVGVQRYVNAIKMATGVSNLERTTFIALSKAISKQSIGLSSRSRRWCPSCFFEHNASGSVCYDRLLWSMVAVIRCPLHKVALVSRCQSCGTLQEFYHRSGGLGLCWKCSQGLLTESSHWTVQLHPSFGERDCAELVAAISSGELVASYPSAFQVFFSTVLQAAPSKKRLRFGRELFGLAIDNSRALRTQSPHFSTMLRSTHATGVRLIDVLTDPVGAAAVAGGNLVDRVDGRSVRGPHKPQCVIESCGRRLRAELAKGDGENIPGLRKLANEMQVGTGFLRYRFPELVDTYLQRRSQQRRHFIAERSKKMKMALDSGLLLAFPSARYPTQESLAYAVMKACGVGRRVARIAVLEALSGRDVREMPG